MPAMTTCASVSEPSTSNGGSLPTAKNSKSCVAEVHGHLNLLQTARETNDRRLVSRVLHHLPQVRRQLTARIISALLESPVIKGSFEMTATMEAALSAALAAERDAVQAVSSDSVVVVETETSEAGSVADGSLGSALSGGAFVERSAYVLLLLAVYLLDRKSEGCCQAGMETCVMAIVLLEGRTTLPSGTALHRPTFDPLLARHYYFLTRFYELAGCLPALHNFLMAGLRTATLNHDMECATTIYNCILRLHILCDDYESADLLLSKSAFPASGALNSQLARFHYYRARVRAVQLRYNDAADDLDHVMRKAPQGAAARNFLLSATKFSIIVQLLKGEIPDRGIFRLHPRSLQPYLELAQAVRLGDLAAFQHAIQQFASVWMADGTATLLRRLHQNVLRVGLRRLSRAYLRISFADIRAKLGLSSDQDAEFLVVKALGEGVIEGRANHADGHLESRPVTDLYSTCAPQDALNHRTTFLQSMHNDAVRAMRFPERTKKATNAAVEDEHRPTDAELMEEFMDAEEDLF